MPQIISDTYADDQIEVQRQKIRSSLEEIKQQTQEALSKAGITNQVFLLVPARKNSLMMIGTNDDVDDAEWQRVSEVVQSVVEQVMKFGGTISHSIACANITPTSRREDTSDAAI